MLLVNGQPVPLEEIADAAVEFIQNAVATNYRAQLLQDLDDQNLRDGDEIPVKITGSLRISRTIPIQGSLTTAPIDRYVRLWHTSRAAITRLWRFVR
jgi:hypothetical protein